MKTPHQSVQSQSCPTLCDLMDCSTPGFPVHHQLPEFTQTHVHRVSDAIQSSHSLSPPSPPTFNLSQHQGLFKWVSYSTLYKLTQLHPTAPHPLPFLPLNHKYVCLFHTCESISCSVVSDCLWPHGLWSTRLAWDFPGKNTGVGSHSLLQGIFPTQSWNLGLLHCRQILYSPSHFILVVFNRK